MTADATDAALTEVLLEPTPPGPGATTAAPQHATSSSVVERRGLTVYVDGQPGPTLAAPILTHPQDWTPHQAALLWTEARARPPNRSPRPDGHGDLTSRRRRRLDAIRRDRAAAKHNKRRGHRR